MGPGYDIGRVSLGGYSVTLYNNDLNSGQSISPGLTLSDIIFISAKFPFNLAH